MAEYIGQNIYIKPTYLVSLPEFSGSHHFRSQLQLKSEINLKSNNNNGKLSFKSSRKLCNAVNWLVSSSKDKALYSKKHKKFFYFKINFITLTIPKTKGNLVDEKTAKRCLHAWLAYSRKYFYLRNYVWKFEKTAAGQLHIHLTTDTYINYKKIQQSWNRVLDSNGLLDEYKKVHGHNNANSTDVHAVRKVKDIAAYISKYMAKSTETLSEYKGRIWACNREISEVNSCNCFIDRHSTDVGIKHLLSSKIEYKPINSPPDKFGLAREIGQIYFMNEKSWQLLQQSVIRDAFDNHRFYIRNNIMAMPEEYYQSSINEYFDNYENKNKNTKAKASVQLQDGSVIGAATIRYETRKSIPIQQGELCFA